MTDTLLQQWQDANPDATVVTITDTYNGWANYETWNASLWLGNDEMLYSIARRAYSWRNCIDLLMLHGITETGDGVRYDDVNIDAAEMEEFLEEL